MWDQLFVASCRALYHGERKKVKKKKKKVNAYIRLCISGETIIPFIYF